MVSHLNCNDVLSCEWFIRDQISHIGSFNIQLLNSLKKKKKKKDKKVREKMLP